MPLTTEEKELVAVAVSVAAGCRPCTTWHVKQAKAAGADDAAVAAAVAAAVCVRKDATDGMRRHALGLGAADSGCGCVPASPLRELCSLGAALAVNCTANIERHLAATRALEVPPADLEAVAGLVATVRGHAVKHATTAYGGAEQPAAASCCG